MSLSDSSCSSSSSGLEENCTKILLIRHAEKHHWPSGLEASISKSDYIDNHLLSGKGCERAHALVGYFFHRHEMKDIFSSYPLRAVIAQEVDEVENWGLSLRPKQTVEPLLKALKSAPVLRDGPSFFSITSGEVDYFTFPKRQFGDLLSKLRETKYHGHSVIVCWSHQQLSVIVKELGALDAPEKWPKSRYDLVWALDMDTSGKVVKFEEIPQRLLFGDRKD